MRCGYAPHSHTAARAHREFPGAPYSGGSPADKAGLLLLLAELRAAVEAEAAATGAPPLLVSIAVSASVDVAVVGYDAAGGCAVHCEGRSLACRGALPASVAGTGCAVALRRAGAAALLWAWLAVRSASVCWAERRLLLSSPHKEAKLPLFTLCAVLTFRCGVHGSAASPCGLGRPHDLRHARYPHAP